MKYNSEVIDKLLLIQNLKNIVHILAGGYPGPSLQRDRPA
jgi:hypothetical protein